MRSNRGLLIALGLALAASLAMSSMAACGSTDAITPAPADGGPLDSEASETKRDAPETECTPGRFQWATAGVGQTTATSAGIALAPDGSTWIVGVSRGVARWGSFDVGLADRPSAFVVKIDASGNVVFATSFVANAGGGSMLTRVRVDGAGNVFALGTFRGDLTIGGTKLSAGTRAGMLVVKLEPSGNVVWAKQTTGTGEAVPMDLAIGATGEMIVTGYYSGGAITFEGLPPLTSAATDNAVFAAQLRQDGTAVWSRSWFASLSAMAFGVAASTEGTFFLVGAYSGRIDFDGHALGVQELGPYRPFVIRMGRSGQPMWAAEAMPANEELDVVNLRAIATDTDGNGYAVGDFAGTAIFRSASPATSTDVSIDAGSADDMVIAKYDLNGRTQWVRRAGGPNVTPVAQTYATDVATDGTDIYTVGSIHGPGTRRFDSLELTTTGVLFVARYDANGNARNVFGIGGTNAPDDGDAHGIAVVKGRGISVAGILRGSWQFGTLPPITSTGFQTQLAVAAHACE